MISIEAFLASLRAYLGVPFIHQGRTRQGGLDCAGLLKRGLTDNGEPCTDVHGYHRRPQHDRLIDAISGIADRVEANSSEEPGQILVTSCRPNGRAQHIAIRTSPGNVIHAVAGRGVREEAWKTVSSGAYVHSVWRLRCLSR